MKKHILASIAALAALGSMSASAATLSDQATVTVDVVPFCSLLLPADWVYTMPGQLVRRSFQLEVRCNENMPYTLESDAGSNGAITLTDAGSGKTMPAFLRQETAPNVYAAAWGQSSNGEGWSRTGTGTLEYVNWGLDVNVDDLNGVYFKKAAVGTYTSTINVTLTY